MGPHTGVRMHAGRTYTGGYEKILEVSAKGMKKSADIGMKMLLALIL